MSLADGEYEIDLSSLLDLPPISNDTNNIAIRYGFIPDSMDQSKPIKLYQNKDECILETTDSDNKSILFEGIPQRGGAATDSYYLTYTPDKDTVELKKLATTIRFNKSRNVNKLNNKIKQWERQVREKPKSNVRKLNSPSVLPVKPSTPKTASKRPPSAATTPNIKLDHDEPIISESDFDDLDESDGDGFPVITIDDVKPIKVQEKSVEMAVQEKLAGPVKSIKKDVNPSQKQPQPKIEPSEKSMDLDDDFKDLEDQLQEVLEEEEPKQAKADTSSIKFEDSDESDVDDFSFTGIKIDEGVSQPKKNPVFNAKKSGSKPMSLRDLVGESKTRDDDLSSSEEE